MTRLPESRPIFITGMMGSGKTWIGSLLAQHMRIPFRDSDQMIENASGMSVSAIFAQDGEAEFRRREYDVIDRQIKQPRHVLALGGGAFMDSRLREKMRGNVFSIWLKVPPNVLYDRIHYPRIHYPRTQGKNNRPLLKDGKEKTDIIRILKEREPIYALADITIDGDNNRPHIIKNIHARLAERGVRFDDNTSRESAPHASN